MIEHLDDILKSDLLERYIQGEASQDERQKVEFLCVEHRSIRDRLLSLESKKESINIDRKKLSSPKTGQCIIKNISGQNITDTSSTHQKALPRYRWTYLAPASIAALVTWGFMNTQVSDYKKEIVEQSAEMADLRRDYDKVNQIYAYISHGGTMPYILGGPTSTSENQVIIYWNPSLQKSMLRVIELPSIRANESFQLWADVDGEMLSLGTFDAGLAINDAIPVDYVDRATSFNITIEPKGGSDHPTLSTLTASQTM